MQHQRASRKRLPKGENDSLFMLSTFVLDNDNEIVYDYTCTHTQKYTSTSKEGQLLPLRNSE
jgi:hypothetical protein